MKLKELQKLISAGVFSATLLAGAAYANDAATTTPSGTPAKPHKGHKHKMEKHACKGQNSCKFNGGCKTGDKGCKGKNSCKGNGGCATDGSTPPAGAAAAGAATGMGAGAHSCKGQNACNGKGGCKTGDKGCKGKNSCKGNGGCATDGSK